MERYLPGGASRCGKSTLAKMLQERNSLKHYDGDDIRIKLFKDNSLDEDDFEYYFGLMSQLRAEHIGGKSNFEKIVNDIGIDQYLILEKRMNNYVFKQGISPILQRESGIVIEGVQNTPEAVGSYLRRNNDKDTKIIYLVRTGVGSIMEGLERDPGTFKGRDPDLAAKFIQEYSLKVQQEAQRFGFEVIDTSVGNFKDRLEEAYEYLTAA